MEPKAIHLSPEDISVLRSRFEKLPETSLFREHLALAAQMASFGIFREVGTVNDELARFIFDAATGQPVRRESLKVEMVEWNGMTGLKVFSEDSVNLELRTPGFYDSIHPKLSFNAEGLLTALYIFPEIIERIARAQGVDLVMVKSWGLNSIFGGFDPKKEYYQTNFWEIENNDVLKFADLTRQGQIAFMGTHDLIAHISGVEKKAWMELRRSAELVYQTVKAYFAKVPKPGISSLILPYAIGVVLDDLAQPPSFGSRSHLAVLRELLKELESGYIPADLKTVLTKFPPGFQAVIEMSRADGMAERKLEIRTTIQEMTRQILSSSFAIPA